MSIDTKTNLAVAPAARSARRFCARLRFMIGVAAMASLLAASQSFAAAWERHTIDNTARGADGVRFADVNGDGLPDIATGFEASGLSRVYLHPGTARVRNPWPMVTVGAAGDVEDAVFADLDGDGAIDVISSSEGRTRAVWIHWGPREPERLLDPSAWRTDAIPAASGRQWMFCVPLQIDGRHGPDLVIGSKGNDACIAWLESPPNPRQVEDWKFHLLRPAGWIMSLIASDMDGDGHSDIVLSDRKRAGAGVFWLRNPGPGEAQKHPWKEYPIGSVGQEAMFATIADLDGDGLDDVLVAVAPSEIHWHRRLDRTGVRWETHVIPLPEAAGTAKSVAVGDINLDGRMDIVFSCEGAAAPKHGIMWLSNPNPFDSSGWIAHELSGVYTKPSGSKWPPKYDLVELIDLDGDGDLDVVTTEEGKELGVIWYENPTKSPAAFSPGGR